MRSSCNVDFRELADRFGIREDISISMFLLNSEQAFCTRSLSH